MRRGIFLSWHRKIGFFVRNPDNPTQALKFNSRRGYIWWMTRRPRSAGKHFLQRIQYLFWRLLSRVIRIVKVGRKERQAVDAIVADFFEEHARVSKAWNDARRRGDPTALKYEKELWDSIATREHWDAGEWSEMRKKWYYEAY